MVVNLRLDPFHSWFVRLHPSARKLESVRDSLADRERLRIADDQEKLEILHEMLVEEYDFDEQYTPVEFRFLHNSIEMRYAEQRTQGRRNTTDEELVDHMDERISEKLGRVVLGAVGICVVSFAGLFITAIA